MLLKQIKLIDLEWIDNRIKELETKILNKSDENNIWYMRGSIDLLKELKLQLKPSESLIEDAFDAGYKFKRGEYESWETYNKFTGNQKPNQEITKQEYLNKDFEI